MKKFLALLLLVFLCLPFAACDKAPEGTQAPTEAPTAAPTEKPTEGEAEPVIELKDRTYNLALNASNVKRLGRSNVTSNGITCDYTASGIEFEAYIKGEFSFDVVNASGDVYFTVFVDGERLEERFYVKGNGGTVNVTGLSEDTTKPKSIRILKQTEHTGARCELSSLAFFGQLMGPTAEREFYIEFIGDSITSGYGNLIYGAPTDGSDPGAAINSDGTQSYAFLAADLIEADSSVIGWSGIGLQKGYSGTLVKDYYQADSYQRDSGTKKFDFTKARKPDVVVVNIGTNDQTFLGQGQGSKAAFEAEVKNFINIIREGYGEDTPILWVYGMMGVACSDVTLKVFEELGGEAAELYTLGVEANHSGGNGHPELDAHYDYAELVATKIEEIIYQ